MTIETQIRRLRERITRAADSLIWYHRTRPDPWRYLAAPGLGAFLTLWLSVAWGLFGPLLALVIVGSFAVFAIQLVEELRSLEAEAKAGIELEAGDVPWLAGLTEEEPSQPSTEARAPRAEGPSELDLPGPTPRLGDEPAPAGAPPAMRGAGLLATKPAPVAARSVSDAPVYEVREVVDGAHLLLQTGPSFLEACDVAFELMEENDPAELEIVRAAGEEREIVWAYRRSESAAQGERAVPANVVGLDVTRSTDSLS
jgi:hypothetical protein